MWFTMCSFSFLSSYAICATQLSAENDWRRRALAAAGERIHKTKRYVCLEAARIGAKKRNARIHNNHRRSLRWPDRKFNTLITCFWAIEDELDSSGRKRLRKSQITFRCTVVARSELWVVTTFLNNIAALLALAEKISDNVEREKVAVSLPLTCGSAMYSGGLGTCVRARPLEECLLLGYQTENRLLDKRKSINVISYRW